MTATSWRGKANSTDDKGIWLEACMHAHTVPLDAVAEQAGRKSCSEKKGKHESQT